MSATFRTIGHTPRIALLGLGLMGQGAHLPSLVRLAKEGRCEIKGVCDLNREQAEVVAASYGIDRVYSDLDAIVADPDVDAVVAIHYWGQHHSTAMKVLGAGKHLLTEKPFIPLLSQAEEAAHEAQSRGLLYAVGHMKRYDPAAAVAREKLGHALEHGDLGHLCEIESIWQPGDWWVNAPHPIRVGERAKSDLPNVAMPAGIDSEPKRWAFWMMFDVLGHNVNLIHHLVETEIEPIWTRFVGRRSYTIVGQAGCAPVLIRAVFEHTAAWREVYRFRFYRGLIELRMPPHMDDNATGTVLVRHYDRNTGIETEETLRPGLGWSFFLQAQAFLAAIRGEEEYKTPAHECVRDVRFMERAVPLISYEDFGSEKRI